MNYVIKNSTLITKTGLDRVCLVYLGANETSEGDVVITDLPIEFITGDVIMCFNTASLAQGLTSEICPNLWIEISALNPSPSVFTTVGLKTARSSSNWTINRLIRRS